MSNIFLNEEQLDEKINNLLTRKNRLHHNEPARLADQRVSIDRLSNTAVISR